jgi:16S rRNA processing protein RimM
VIKFLEKKNLTAIGRVNKAVGFKGALSCLVTLAHPEKLLKHNFLFVIIEGLPVPFHVEEMEFRGEEMIVKFEDINDEVDAKRLGQKDLYAEKVRPSKKEEVITWNDLQGYNVHDSVFGDLGPIEEVIEYPMQMIARCTVKNNEVLFPLNEEIIKEIDDENQIVYVDLPEGLLDIYFDTDSG